MNPTMMITALISCLILMFNVAHAFTLTEKTNEVEQGTGISPNKYLSIFQDDGSMLGNSDEFDEHEFAKRRFNAWAGKRSLMSKRRFNAWAGRR